MDNLIFFILQSKFLLTFLQSKNVQKPSFAYRNLLYKIVSAQFILNFYILPSKTLIIMIGYYNYVFYKCTNLIYNCKSVMSCILSNKIEQTIVTNVTNLFFFFLLLYYISLSLLFILTLLLTLLLSSL